MRIDENTRGSIAHNEAVKLLKGWLVALYFADILVCVMVGFSRGMSETHVLWIAFKSLFFSYVLGIVLLIVGLRLFGRRLGIMKLHKVGLLRFFVVLGCLSVLMGAVLAYREPVEPPPTTEEPAHLDAQSEQWQSVKDAKALCAKEGKKMAVEKLDSVNRGVTFICVGEIAPTP